MTYTVDRAELRKVMFSKGFNSMSSLSRATGLSNNTLSKLSTGKLRPSANIIDKIAKELELSGDDIGRIFFKKDLA